MNTPVLCFAQPIPAKPAKDILLVLWGADGDYPGRLHLPGGLSDQDELPEVAAYRVLLEQTGIRASLPDVRVLGGFMWRDQMIRVALCPYHAVGVEPVTGRPEVGTTLSIPAQLALTDPRLAPNLKIIIPLCQAGVTGWTLTDMTATGQYFTVTV